MRSLDANDAMLGESTCSTTASGAVFDFALSLSQMGAALPEGHIEERVQIDRRRLEAMIIGAPSASSVVAVAAAAPPLPDAFEFFADVSRRSPRRWRPMNESAGRSAVECARSLAVAAENRRQGEVKRAICIFSLLANARKHPLIVVSRGSKASQRFLFMFSTSKHPFVKIIGEPNSVQTAKDLILSVLRVKVSGAARKPSDAARARANAAEESRDAQDRDSAHEPFAHNWAARQKHAGGDASDANARSFSRHQQTQRRRQKQSGESPPIFATSIFRHFDDFRLAPLLGFDRRRGGAS